MKKLSVLFSALVLMALLPVTVLAQQISQNTLKQVLMLSGNLDQYVNQSPEAMQSFVSMAKMYNPALSDAQAQEKIKAYMKEQVVEDLSEVMAPYFTTMTEAEGAELIKEFSTPENQAMIKRVSVASLQQSNQISQQTVGAMQQIMMGQEPAPIAYEESTESYRNKFDEYCNIFDLEAQITSAMGGVSQMLEMVPAEQRAPVEKALKGVTEYMSTNIRPMTFNMFRNALTEDDLQRYIDIYATPAGKHMLEGTQNMTSDLMKVMMQFSAKMMEHLK